MYNTYVINKMVDTKIKVYARRYKKYGSDLDRLERDQRQIESEIESKIREKGYIYSKECDFISNAHELIQKRFDFYFKSGNLYVWLTGNENFKKLIDAK